MLHSTSLNKGQNQREHDGLSSRARVQRGMTREGYSLQSVDLAFPVSTKQRVWCLPFVPISSWVTKLVTGSFLATPKDPFCGIYYAYAQCLAYPDSIYEDFFCPWLLLKTPETEFACQRVSLNVRLVCIPPTTPNHQLNTAVSQDRSVALDATPYRSRLHL